MPRLAVIPIANEGHQWSDSITGPMQCDAERANKDTSATARPAALELPGDLGSLFHNSP